MDGNGRWAKKRGLPRSFGHREGAKNFKKIVRYCKDIGLKNISFYAFSTENWQRPKDEVDTIMDLFRDYVDRSGIYGKGTNLGAALEYLCSLRPPALGDAATLIILSDAKTVEQGRAFTALQKAKQLSGKVLWLNPIPFQCR